MIFDAESGGSNFRNSLGALLEFEHFAADAADEMMMVTFVRTFISGGLSGDLDGHHAALLRERLQRTIDGRQANGRNVLRREGLNFRGRQGVLVILKDGFDGPFLASASIHFRQRRALQVRLQRDLRRDYGRRQYSPCCLQFWHGSEESVVGTVHYSR